MSFPWGLSSWVAGDEDSTPTPGLAAPADASQSAPVEQAPFTPASSRGVERVALGTPGPLPSP